MKNEHYSPEYMFFFVRQQWNFLYMGDIREEARTIICRCCRAAAFFSGVLMSAFPNHNTMCMNMVETVGTRERFDAK